MKPCKYNIDDGYCIRPENDYCPSDECKEQNYSITEVCSHDIAEIKVISVVGTCETTVLVCTECKEQITELKTECR